MLPFFRIDIWKEIHPNDPGYTYDAQRNAMLGKPRGLRLRLDRAFAKLNSWKVESIEKVGTVAIPDTIHDGKPVLPSDHYGLLVKLGRKK